MSTGATDADPHSKYSSRDLKRDLFLGGANGIIFSSIFGFYSASLDKRQVSWIRHFGKTTGKMLPLYPLGRVAYSYMQKNEVEHWKCIGASVLVGFLYLTLVRI